MNLQILFSVIVFLLSLHFTLANNVKQQKHVFKLSEILGQQNAKNTNVYQRIKATASAKTQADTEISNQFRCTAHEEIQTINIDPNCQQVFYKSYFCSGYCKSWVYSEIDVASIVENSETMKPCCRIKSVEYEYGKVNCYKKPAKIVEDLNSNQRHLTATWNYYDERHPLYEGFFLIKYPVNMECSCQKTI